MSLRQFILHNFWLKLFAVLLALLTWFTVRFAISRRVSFGSMPFSGVVTRELPFIPVRLLQAAEDRGAFRIAPREISVTVSGDAALIQQLSGKDLQAFVNLAMGTNFQAGPIKVEVVAPSGVSIKQVAPPEVALERIPLAAPSNN